VKSVAAVSIIALAILTSYLLWQIWPLLLALGERDHLIVATWIMALFTIVLAVFTVLQGIATRGQLKAFREAQTWDRLREHSKKLGPVLSEWIEKLATVTPGKLSIEHGKPSFSILVKPSHVNLDALWAHIETGYKDEAAQWQWLLAASMHHRRKSENFFKMVHDKIKRRVRLPTYFYRGKEPDEWFNSLRCAEIAYSVLVGEVQADYYLKDNPPKISKSKPHELQWPAGTTVAKSNHETQYTVVQQAVTDLMNDPTMIREASQLAGEARRISDSLNFFQAFLKKSINLIQLGGILEGECEYCCQLKLR
jgi:hypothetical protein